MIKIGSFSRSYSKYKGAGAFVETQCKCYIFAATTTAFNFALLLDLTLD